MALKRLVQGVEILAALGAVVFVIMLFANEPSGSSSASSDPGTEVYTANCARCHGADGGGGIGPQLSDGSVEEAFPDVDDEVVIVTEGEGSMPSFGGTLSEQEIQQVVDYTRTL